MEYSYEEYLIKAVTQFHEEVNPGDENYFDAEHAAEQLGAMLTREIFYKELAHGTYEDVYGSFKRVLLELVEDIATKAYTGDEMGNGMSREDMLTVVSELHNYDVIKDVIFLRAINYEKSRDELERLGAIYEVYGDMALALYALTAESEKSMSSLKIPNETFKKWGVSREEAWGVAMRNTVEFYPARLLPLKLSVMASFDQEVLDERNDPLNDGGFEFKKSAINIYSITAENTTNGATALFYPGLLDRLYEVFGEDFYIVPHNVEDAMLHPVSTTTELEVRRRADASKYDPYNPENQRLSARAYRYSASLGKLEMLRKYR